ncbi:MAG TPA: hypothetical protein VF071_08585 [Candidatus Limnocylindria bacterium]
MSTLVAAIPYTVLQLDRALRWLLRGFGGVTLLIVLLLGAAAVAPAIEASEVQPISQSVDELRDGVSSLSGWVRMRGQITTLTSPEAVEAGQQVQSLLVEPSGDAIVLISPGPLDHLQEITGHVSNSANAGQTARNVGGPRFPAGDLEVIDRYVITVDDPIVPGEQRSWWLVWTLLIAAAVLFVGQRVGYPVIHLQRDRAPAGGARPLSVGERIDVRVLEPQDETAPRLRGPWGSLQRLERRDPTDPYFSLVVPDHGRPTQFRRHRWSRATPGTLWTVTERMPVVHLHDWGIEVVLGLRTEAERERLLASFVIDDEEDAAVGPERASGSTRA